MMFFTKADKEDFEQVQKLYWNLIDKSQDEESFPGWKKGVYPSDDMIRQNIECGYLYVLKDDGIIKACAICNPYANEEYKQVPWKVNDGPVWIIHTLAVDYDSRNNDDDCENTYADTYPCAFGECEKTQHNFYLVGLF